MLNIESIQRGIVIDHIKPNLGLRIFKDLQLDKVDFQVALIMNVCSKKYGKKELIKIANKIDLDLNILGLIDPDITVNIIEDEKIIEKIKLELTEKVEEILDCKNPRCITSEERYIVNKFTLIDRENKKYKCEYCDNIRKI